MRWLAILLVVLTLPACSDRTVSVIAPDAVEIGTPRTVFAASTRARERNGTYGFRRAERLQYLEMTVTVPPSHKPGQLIYSYDAPDASTQFVLAGLEELNSPAELGRRILQKQNGPGRDVTIFVHGYNATQTETAFRAAQLAEDIGMPGSLLIYSWPSRASAFGYAYDIDSMLFARDGLEETIRQLDAQGIDKIGIVAHSMGSALTMEMMRQAELKEPGWAARTLDGVVLISPDLDVDVFKSQMDRISKPPKPFVVMVSKKDKALNISARLRGTNDSKRLGNLASVDQLADYPVDIIDTTAFSDDAESSHFVAATSPALISILSSARKLSDTFRPEEAAIGFLTPAGKRRRGQATEIVLAPVDEGG